MHDSPGQESVEIELHRVGDDLLGLEGVDHPHSHVADQQEGDNLPAGLAAIMLRQMNTPARHVGNKQHLEDHLGDREQSSHHHQEIRFMRKGRQRTGNHAEDGVDEETEGGDAQEDIVEIALLLGFKLETLHADEADDYGDDG